MCMSASGCCDCPAMAFGLGVRLHAVGEIMPGVFAFGGVVANHGRMGGFMDWFSGTCIMPCGVG